jgi:DNA-binding response OmpR family regulator
MEKSNIVIIEDELEIVELISNYLKEFEMNVKSFGDGKSAIEYIQSLNSSETDLFILDRMLPSISGLEILKFIRMYKPTNKTPVLMLTALGTPEQIIEGLDSGADDYMTKPFDLNILNARVRSLLRRREGSNTPAPTNKNLLQLKDIAIDLEQCKTTIKGLEIELTLSEYKLLCCFLSSPGKVFTRNQLVEFIQDGPVHVTDRTIDTHIFGLRKKLGDFSTFIETIRGVGYRVTNND